MKTDSFNLTSFSSISLEDLNKVKLRDRQDTKFVFNQNILPLLLDKLKSYYQILEINSMQTFAYENTYYDTEDFLFYKQHHNQNRERFKVRYRKYNSNDRLYFEIKTKNNKDRTIKNRLRVARRNSMLGNPEKQLVSKIIGLSPQQLTPKLDVQFSRITLVDNSFNERLTIDTDLSVKNGISSKIFNQLVISEIKQKMYNPKSAFIQLLRELKIPEMRFSKYCMGVLHIDRKVKYNRFKPKLLRISKILTQD